MLPKTATAEDAIDGGDLVSLLPAGFSADGSRLAVHSYNEGNESISPRRTSDLKAIATVRSDDSAQSAWDRTLDRLAIVATTDDSGRLTVSLVNSTSGKVSSLWSADDSIAQSLAWSPDGRCLLVTSRPSSMPLARADAGAHEINAIDVATGAGDSFARGISATYNPDGRTMFYYGEVDGRVTLIVANGDGLGARAVAGTGSRPSQAASEPITFAADGQVGVYTRRPSMSSGEVRLIGPTGDDDSSLAKYSSKPLGPAVWAPDSKRVAFTVQGPENTGPTTLVIANARTGEILESSKAPGAQASGAIAWLPDGSGVVVSVENGRTAALYVFADGTWTAQTEPAPGYAVGSAVWSPDGDTIAWAEGWMLHLGRR